jgi:NitT/TauT family transport system ATP-binding protein
MIQVKNVWKNYGDTQVLERINLIVNAGDFVALVGTSGCGKSTFLRMLLGVESPSKGAIYLDGAPIATEPGPDRGIVFQRYSVFPHLTVLGNVMATRGFQSTGMTGLLFGKARKEAKRDALDMLEKVGLIQALLRYPHELSGGMLQRLAIAQTLIANPRVLLLDEPFAALDPGIQADMHELLLALWREHNITVVMVTHSLSEGFYLGNRVVVFDKLRHDPHEPNAYGATITYDLPATDNQYEETA